MTCGEKQNKNKNPVYRGSRRSKNHLRTLRRRDALKQMRNMQIISIPGPANADVCLYYVLVKTKH